MSKSQAKRIAEQTGQPVVEPKTLRPRLDTEFAERAIARILVATKGVFKIDWGLSVLGAPLFNVTWTVNDTPCQLMSKLEPGALDAVLARVLHSIQHLQHDDVHGMRGDDAGGAGQQGAADVAAGVPSVRPEPEAAAAPKRRRRPALGELGGDLFRDLTSSRRRGKRADAASSADAIVVREADHDLGAGVGALLGPPSRRGRGRR